MVYRTIDAIEALVKHRGETAGKIWHVINPLRDDPGDMLRNFKRAIPFFKEEFREEAESIIKDIEKILKNPPLP